MNSALLTFCSLPWEASVVELDRRTLPHAATQESLKLAVIRTPVLCLLDCRLW